METTLDLKPTTNSPNNSLFAVLLQMPTKNGLNRTMACIRVSLLAVGVSFIAGPLRSASAADGWVLAEQRDGRLSLSVLALSGLSVAHDNTGVVVNVGSEVRYRVAVKNVSEDLLTLPGSPSSCACLDVQLGKPKSPLCFRGGAGPQREVMKLRPAEKIEFDGAVTVLDSDANVLRCRFVNHCEVKAVDVFRRQGETVDGKTAMMATTETEPIKGVWTGDLSVSSVLTVETQRLPRIEEFYCNAMGLVVEWETRGSSIAYMRQNPDRRQLYSHANASQQSEVIELIRRIGNDANTQSVVWLWDCFSKTGKNSPAHIAAMSELYYLLAQGIGCDYGSNFVAVAVADKMTEAVATRLLAMDAVGLYCERERFECRLKGNWFVTPISARAQKSAREALTLLARDSVNDIRIRAERLLGIEKPKEHRGTRKYIRAAGTVDGEDMWTPGPEAMPPETGVESPPKTRDR